MQQDNPTLPHWLTLALYGVAWLLGTGGIVKLVTIYQNRRKPAADVNKSYAETAEITVRAHSSAGDAVIKFMDRLDDAQLKIDRLYADNERLRTDRDDFKRKFELQVIELTFEREQRKTLKGKLDANGIKYSDGDEHMI